MSDLIGILSEQFGGDVVEAISNQLQINPQQAQSALGSALPILLNALANNSAEEEGANSLYRAVEKDHDGSVWDNLSGFLNNFEQGPGAGILGHILGGRQGLIEEVIGRASGLNPQTAGMLMRTVAPLLMGVLGKARQREELDSRGMSQVLRRTVEATAQQEPQSMGAIGKLLDQDGDGDVKDDIAQMGFRFLTGLMGRR